MILRSVPTFEHANHVEDIEYVCQFDVTPTDFTREAKSFKAAAWLVKKAPNWPTEVEHKIFSESSERDQKFLQKLDVSQTDLTSNRFVFLKRILAEEQDVYLKLQYDVDMIK